MQMQSAELLSPSDSILQFVSIADTIILQFALEVT